MARIKTARRLIVEGHDDKHSVIGLMRWHVDWPAEATDAPVWIEVGSSVDEILEPAHITALLKSREISVLGVMLDADAKPWGRYESIRSTCADFFPSLPKQMPTDGLVVENEDKRLGLWVMPDNSAEGCLETFLRYLVPDESEELWKHAMDAVISAKTIGAKYRAVHTHKANLYTWLAWQDPPGQSPGLALTKKILDPHSKNADSFVKWFRQLYKL